MDGTKAYYDLLKKAQIDKMTINRNTLIKIKKAYEKVAKELINKAYKGEESKGWNDAYLKYVNKKLDLLGKQIEEMIKEGITETSYIASSVNNDFLKGLDIDSDLFESLFGVNYHVIDKIVNGGLYKDNKSLSDRIWGYNKKNLEAIQDILTDGIVNKRPLQDICKELEHYTKGGISKVKTINKAYGSMNANALRLVRTSLNHAFTETMKDETRHNPFVEGYQWILSGQHSIRMQGHTDICDEYANSDEFGLGTGIYPKNADRFIHPNCLCIQVPYIPRQLDDIGSEINRWIHGEENKGIDKWVRSRQ